MNRIPCSPLPAKGVVPERRTGSYAADMSARKFLPSDTRMRFQASYQSDGENLRLKASGLLNRMMSQFKAERTFAMASIACGSAQALRWSDDRSRAAIA
jgi:hypothetical protein